MGGFDLFWVFTGSDEHPCRGLRTLSMLDAKNTKHSENMLSKLVSQVWVRVFPKVIGHRAAGGEIKFACVLLVYD